MACKQGSEAQMKALQAQMASGGMPSNPQQAAAAQERAEQEKQMREDLLTKLVSPEARERLSNIMLVKPQKVGAHSEKLEYLSIGSKLYPRFTRCFA